MSVDYVYSDREQIAYDEGRQARREGRDYFDSPHLKAEGRDLYLLCAWGEGYLDEEREANT